MNKTTLKEYINTFDDKFNGNFSIIYPYIKDRLLKYKCEELPFPGEFLFFEERYVAIYKDIKKRKLKENKIIDIGCQLGIQSEIFKNEYKYLGIDVYDCNFFNINDKNCTFIVDSYPFNLKYYNSIVISCMSIGYFHTKEEEDEYYSKIIEEFKKIKYLYIATNKKLLSLLSECFKIEHLNLGSKETTDVHNNLYFLERKLN